jgi:hypothetical protein
MGMDYQGPYDNAADRFLSGARCKLVLDELEHHPALLGVTSDILRSCFDVQITYQIVCWYSFVGYGWNVPPRIMEGGDGSDTEADSGC